MHISSLVLTMIIHSLESPVGGRMDILSAMRKEKRMVATSMNKQILSGNQRERAAISGSARSGPASRSYTLARSRLILTPLIRTPRSLQALLWRGGCLNERGFDPGELEGDLVVTSWGRGFKILFFKFFFLFIYNF